MKIWINDIKAQELINLETCINIFKRTGSKNDKPTYKLKFAYSAQILEILYETEKQRDNAYLHYASILQASEMDASKKPITL